MNRQAVGIFKVLSITKLANIFESLIDIGNPFHESSSFPFYLCLCTEFINTCSRIFLIINIFLIFIEYILEYINDVVCLSFLSNEGDTTIFYKNDNDTIETFVLFYLMEDKTIVHQKIIIISI